MVIEVCIVDVKSCSKMSDVLSGPVLSLPSAVSKEKRMLLTSTFVLRA